MTIDDFVNELIKIGYSNVRKEQNFVKLEYKIPVGSRAGEVIKMAFQVGNDFPLNPPGGPHISPMILKLHPQPDLPHPYGAVHPSPTLGNDWEYLSRPYREWGQSDKTVKTYMRYINSLFESI